MALCSYYNNIRVYLRSIIITLLLFLMFCFFPCHPKTLLEYFKCTLEFLGHYTVFIKMKRFFFPEIYWFVR